MSTIMMDNRGITNAISGMYNIKNILYKKDLADFLTLFVLWDEIYYPKYSMEMLWKGIVNENQVFNYIKPIDISEIGLYDENEIKLLSENVPTEYRNAIQYLFFCNQYGLNYCPSKSNSEFLSKLLNYNFYNIKGSVLDYFSKDVFEKYMNFKYVKGCVTFPNIGNYIIDNTDEGGRYLKTAIDIKNDKKYKNFKRYLDEIEEQIDNGNIREYKRCLKNISEMTNEIGEKDNIFDKISYSISLIPFQFNIQVNPKTAWKNKAPIAFLKDIAEYYLL